MRSTHQLIDQRIKAGILLFWALYFSIICVSNSTDALKTLGLLPPDFRFVSGNYNLVSKVVGIYDVTAGLAGLFFAGVILWEGIGAFLFWKALIGTVRQPSLSQSATYLALGVTLGLWAMFIVIDEVFLAYEYPGLSATFFSLLLSELGTLILFRLIDQEQRT
ncbi:hypothetical protein A6C57_12745 [Fibrella sp. ES10-3-2-2]|nr:hypothetical protein A6C57_12745 [Fibrella sp. ES10-3-2-2]